jgi:hypothetical protein
LLEVMGKKRLLPPCLEPLRTKTFHAALRDNHLIYALAQEAARFAAASNDVEVTRQHTQFQAAVGMVSRMLSARRRCIELLTSIVPIGMSDCVRRRLLDVGTCDPFEALFCAVAAYAKAKDASRQYPHQHPRKVDIGVEGLVFVPDYARLRGLSSRGPTGCWGGEPGVGIPAEGRERAEWQP